VFGGQHPKSLSVHPFAGDPQSGFMQNREGFMRRWIVTMAITLIALPLTALAAGTDQETAQQIADSLRASGRMKGYSIAVKYKEGTARLEGSVRSQQQLEQALEIVNRTPEVKRVINNLSIDPGAQHVSAREPVDAAPAQQPVREAAPNTFRGGFFRKLTGGSEQSPARNGDAPTAAEQQPMQPNMKFSSNNAQHVSSLQIVSAGASQSQQQAQPMPMQTQATQAQPMQAQHMHAQPMPQGRPMVLQAPPMGVPMQQVAYPGGMPGGYPGGYGHGQMHGGPRPEYVAHTGAATAAAVYDQPHLPNYAWPSYAAYPNYAALTYPKQYSPTAWPYIGPFYPYPQVPLGWRKVTLEWDDGWWFLNFADDRRHVGHY
jgi:hypothetical protein